MSKDTKTVSVRLTTDEIALLDDLAKHFGGRSKAIKIMIRFYYSMLHPQFWKTTKLNTSYLSAARFSSQSNSKGR